MDGRIVWPAPGQLCPLATSNVPLSHLFAFWCRPQLRGLQRCCARNAFATNGVGSIRLTLIAVAWKVQFLLVVSVRAATVVPSV